MISPRIEARDRGEMTLTEEDICHQRCRTGRKKMWTLSSLVLTVLLLLGHSNVCFADEQAYYLDDSGQLGFDDVSVMPVSCITYNNGNMIKYELFENNNNYQCHMKNLGVFVVSIAHYMRAYFNYQALTDGADFALPSDAGYLNCVLLQQTAYTNRKLYAKIGCMNRETFTSTKLQIHVYEDNMCSTLYDDGNTDRYHVTKGYNINGYLFNTKVSFRPPFYSCLSCKPDYVSDTFNKDYYWYDDDVINAQENEDDGDDEYYAADDNSNSTNDDDNYFQTNDDTYLDNYTYQKDDAYYQNETYDDVVASYDDAVVASYDDAADDGGDNASAYDDVADDAAVYDDYNQQYYYNENHNQDDDDFYTANDDGRRLLGPTDMIMKETVSDQLKGYQRSFWRNLEVDGWNMCDRLFKYGMWCDDECRALETFRVDEWSNSDVFLLAIMCIFMSAMMLLIFAKRVKAYEKASLYGDELDASYPGLPPVAMVLVFLIIMTSILVLANLKFVNETLVFSVVTCILLFIYMLKLTLFENRGPQLLPAAHRPSVALNSMNRQLFDA